MYRCSKCSGKLAVIRTIKDIDTGLVHRERRCSLCGEGFYTKETVEPAVSFCDVRNRAQVKARRRLWSAENTEHDITTPCTLGAA